MLAFIAPKLVGGADAPTPLGDLGILKMTQAIQLLDSSFELVGPDLLVTAYTPSSGGLSAVAAAQRPPQATPAIEVLFYKSWDEFGGLCNFSPHAIRVGQDAHEWQTVEVRFARQLAAVSAPHATLLPAVVLPGAEVCRRGHRRSPRHLCGSACCCLA